MFENLYTTKMSADKKSLQKRFSKIRSKSGRLSKTMALIMSAAIALAMICSSVVMASLDAKENERYKIEVTGNTQPLEFTNKLHFKNNTLYLPLEELLNKITKNADIERNENIVTINFSENFETDIDAVNRLYYCYRIQIGKAEYTLNPVETLPKDKQHLQLKKEMQYPPELIDGVVYIPFEYVDYMINRVTQTCYVSYSVWDTEYNENTNREADFCNDDITMDYFDNHKNLYTSAEHALKQFVIWPCESNLISAGFGDRVHPVTNEVKEHNGVDIVAAQGTDVVAATDGIVVDADFNKEDGYYVVISSDSTIKGHTLQTSYKYLGALLVNKGDKVGQGDIIGTVGQSGMSTGPHLHFELKLDDTYYDPVLIH